MARGSEGNIRSGLRTLFRVGSLAGHTDGQLLERFAAGRGEMAERAFAALVERHGPMVLRTCRSILRGDPEAEDAFQATFLVLMIKGRSRSLWVRDSLGPWLHRVACRIAFRAGRAEDRRRAAEREGAERAATRRGDQDREGSGPILHEELDRLPARYRIPVVLCVLEGRTYEEAARHLGCPIGTVKSRLARGREQLKARLIRRGLAPAVGLFTTALFEGTASAAVPAVLVKSTCRAASARALTAGVVPASVAGLMRGALRAMRHSMILRVGGVFLAVGLVAAGVGRFAPRASGGPSDEPQVRGTTPDPATARPKEDDGADAERGRVKLAMQRAHQEVEQIEYEAKKEWLREAMKRLGKLELKRRVRDPRPEKDVTLRERKEALDAEEASRRELSEYIEKMHAELIDKGISVNIKKLELLEAERKAQGGAR